MAQVTIEAQASVTIDGQVIDQRTTYIADIRSLLQGTKDVTATYAVMSTAMIAFALIENTGDQPIIVRTLSINPGSQQYMFFGVGAGKHIFISSRTGSQGDGVVVGSGIAIRTVSGTSRVAVCIGTQGTNE